MKSIYHIINLFFLAILLFQCNTGLAQGDALERDVLPVPGASGNSYDWFNFINQLKYQELYKIRDMYSPSGYNFFGTVEQNVVNLNKLINEPPSHITSYNNVLAIGHDVGGLAVRGVERINPKVTGMILVGTPNNGSNLIRDILTQTPSNNSFELWVENLRNFRGNIQCPDCDKVNSLSEYIKRLKNDKNYLSGAIKEPLAYYNTLPVPDKKKTAVIWGNAGDQNLSTLFGHQGGPNPASTIDLDRCARELRAIELAHIKSERKVQTIRKVTGFVTTIANLVSNISSLFNPTVGAEGVKTYPNIAQVTSYINSFVTSLSQTIINDIITDINLSERERNLLICELTNQLMEAEWRLRIANNKGQFVGAINPAYDPVKCQQWTIDCQTEHNVWAKQIACFNKNYYCNPGSYAFVVEPSDMVYTKSEQTIPGMTLEFEIKADHFREQAYSYNKIPMDMLFSGQHGTEFKIPK